MRIDEIPAPPGARKRPKRVGRGIGSGHGKTATRGTKGQKARERVRPGFEGGQTPFQRRMRKLKGISKKAMPIGPFRKEYAIVNVGQLERFQAGSQVDPKALLEAKVIKKLGDGLRVLGKGEIAKPLRVRAHHFSRKASQKIVEAGGSAEVI